MSTPQIGTRNIGGINFLEKEVKSVTIKKDFCMSGDLFTVETTHGTFSYRDFPNSIVSGDDVNVRSIKGGSIHNCTLEKLIGTEKKDVYTIQNSVVNNLDLSGDNGKTDYVHVDNSYIGTKTLDNNDQVYENLNITW